MLRNAFHSLYANLFGYDRPVTPGEVIYFKLFELFVTLALSYQAWMWGFYAYRLESLTMPHGVIAYLGVGSLHAGPLPLLLVNAAAITALLALGYLRIGRWTYLVALLLLHLQYGARFSAGKLEHGTNLLAMTLLGLSLAMVLFSDARTRRRFTMGFVYLFTGIGYVLAAASKLVGTGPIWPAGTHLWLWIHEKGIDMYAQTGTLDFNLLQTYVLSSFSVSTLMLLGGLMFELFAFLIWWRRFRRPLLLGLVGMHIGIYAVMGVLFHWSIIELLFLALPGAAWIDRLLDARELPTWVLSLKRLSLRRG